MVKAIRIHAAGGPEQMQWEDVEVGAPAAGQVRVRHTAIGLNFIDVYHRKGLYPLPLPHGLGMEGAGVVEAIGDGVTDLAEGDRVAYASPPPGSYAEARLIGSDALIKIPDGVDDETAAAMMLKGMTAQFLIRQTYRVTAGDTILIHAAAGGVGQILCQWAKSLGATVIGTVGSPEKAELVRNLGCDHPILYREEDFVSRVAEITNGAKLPVVYDSVGADTFCKSLDCLHPRGILVAFGQSSGPVPPMDVGVLARKGSLFLTRPTLMSYTATRADTVAAADDLFAAVVTGHVNISVEQRFPLADTRDAHEALEARQTTGSTILLP